MAKKSGRKRIAVLMGGPSSEHEVSLASGRMVFKHLDKKKFAAEPVFIDKRGAWLFKGKKSEPMPEPQALLYLRRNKIDLAFLAMHGEYGEDGTIQSLLAAAGVPHTGSNALCSALAMNKYLSLRALGEAGLAIPRNMIFNSREWNRNRGKIMAQIFGVVGLPAVIKPNRRGSSVGVHIVKAEVPNQPETLRKAVDATLAFDHEALAQKCITGREFTCGVVDMCGQSVALPPTEIILTKSGFFDYAEKYSKSGAREVTPPENLDEETSYHLRYNALRAHRVLGCSGVSRTDMILGVEDGKIYVLEVNTIPGMTETSLLPKAAKAAGMDFPVLLEHIIESATIREV